MKSEQKTFSAPHGFTLVEILVAAAIMGFGLIIALPQLRGFTEGGKITSQSGNARALVQAVNIYRARTCNAITGTPVTPMTVARANAIYAQIAGPITPGGEVIHETGFTLPANAEFPAAWGEVSAGVFDPIPVP